MARDGTSGHIPHLGTYEPSPNRGRLPDELEFDVMGKYVAKLLDPNSARGAWAEREVLTEVRRTVRRSELFGVPSLRIFPSNQIGPVSDVQRFLHVVVWSTRRCPVSKLIDNPLDVFHSDGIHPSKRFVQQNELGFRPIRAFQSASFLLTTSPGLFRTVFHNSSSNCSVVLGLGWTNVAFQDGSHVVFHTQLPKHTQFLGR